LSAQTAASAMHNVPYTIVHRDTFSSLHSIAILYEIYIYE
jgi:hypothetical protein